MLNSAKPRSWQRVDELVRRGRSFRENPEPAERIDPFVDGQHAIRNRRPADAVKSIASGNEVAPNLVIGAAMLEAEHGARGVERADRDAIGLEIQRTRRRRARVDQIPDDFILSVDRDRFASRQVGQIDAVPLHPRKLT